MNTYVNPFGAGLKRGRVDMGIDYSGAGSVFAIGNGVVERVAAQGGNTGWPGAAGSRTGAMIVYRLTDGPRAGQHIYLAENVDPAAGLGVGDNVKAGQVIATARGKYPYLETGFSDALGQPLDHASYTEGQQTTHGQEFAAFVSRLSAGPQGKLGSGTQLNEPSAPEKVVNAAGDVVDTVTGVAGDAATATAKAIVKVLWDAIGEDAVKALLYVVFVGGGLALTYAGLNRVLADAPKRAALGLAGAAAGAKAGAATEGAVA